MMLEWMVIIFIGTCGFILFPIILLTRHDTKIRRYVIIPMYLLFVALVFLLSILRIWVVTGE